MKKVMFASLLMAASFVITGCSEEKTQTEGEKETHSVEVKTKDLTKKLNALMGKDELADYKKNELNEQQVTSGTLIEPEKLTADWLSIAPEEIEASISIFLKKEGLEQVPASQVMDYISEMYRMGEVSDNVYDDILNVASRLNEHAAEAAALPDMLPSSEWSTLKETSQLDVAKHVLEKSDMYKKYISYYDMKSIPPELLVDYVNRRIKTNEVEHQSVLIDMNHLLDDMMLVNDHTERLLELTQEAFAQEDTESLMQLYKPFQNEHGLDYIDMHVKLDFLETIKMEPVLDTYYGVADMTYSIKLDKEKVNEYEKKTGKKFKDTFLPNGYEEITNKKVRTLVTIEKDLDTEFGFRIRSIYELDGDEFTGRNVFD